MTNSAPKQSGSLGSRTSKRRRGGRKTSKPSGDDEIEFSLDSPNLHRGTPKESSDLEDCDKDSECGGFVTKCRDSAWRKKLQNRVEESGALNESMILDAQSNVEEVLNEDSILNCDEWHDGEIPETVRPPVDIPAPAEELGLPIVYFEHFFSDDLWEAMVNFTNSHSTVASSGTKFVNVDVDELKSFFGIWMYMGVMSAGSTRDYWSTETSVPQVSSVMSYNRFSQIRASLRFYDKAEEDELDQSDRYRKVSFLIDHIRKKCQGLEQETHFSIDEVMVPYKGTFAGGLRQFIKDKPHRFGFKMFALAGVSGIIYDFFFYSGKSTFQNIPMTEQEKQMGFGAQVVSHLVRSLDDPGSCTMTFDNWYTSVKLIQYLKDEFNLLSSGTVRKNRIDNCPLLDKKDLEKRGRGSYDTKVKGDVQLTKWLDSKIVFLASSVVGTQPEGRVER